VPHDPRSATGPAVSFLFWEVVLPKILLFWEVVGRWMGVCFQTGLTIALVAVAKG
jgi:hypothetical protein